jgi:hypothetical protein
MTRQPALDGRMFMGGVIVQNDVDVLAQRNFAIPQSAYLECFASGSRQGVAIPPTLRELQ